MLKTFYVKKKKSSSSSPYIFSSIFLLLQTQPNLLKIIKFPPLPLLPLYIFLNPLTSSVSDLAHPMELLPPGCCRLRVARSSGHSSLLMTLLLSSTPHCALPSFLPWLSPYISRGFILCAGFSFPALLFMFSSFSLSCLLFSLHFLWTTLFSSPYMLITPKSLSAATTSLPPGPTCINPVSGNSPTAHPVA